MTDLATGPRQLIRRLHQIMADSDSAEARLDRVVRLIAVNMVAEVCSVYLLRAGASLELFATEGLKQSAVHQTRLRVGEGLVGHIAKTGVPLNLPEARDHASFVYRPETGEERFHSLLGVPIIRSGIVCGVLIVQNRTQRHYSDEETEALQTVAMVLAELIGTGELVDLEEFEGNADDIGLPLSLAGQCLAEGVAMGHAVFHEPKVSITRLVADDVESERERLDGALETMRAQLKQMLDATDIGHPGEHREVLETYLMFAYDKGWRVKMHNAVNTGLTAEAAVERVQQDMRTRMAMTTDPYLKERLADIEDLANRLIRTIVGVAGSAAHGELLHDAIVIAKSMGPAELLDYDRQRLKAIVLEEGSPNSHVTIVARAMGIPMLGRVAGVLAAIREGDHLIVDGEGGHVLAHAAEDVIDSYTENIVIREAKALEYEAQKDLPSVSLDDRTVHLWMNAGLTADVAHLERVGAEGIGLFRTEFQFLVSETFPRLEAQMEIYGKVMDAAKGLPVVFRTLDIGGDKNVPFLPRMEEENPALGWRAIRIALDRPALLRYQLRALLMAANGRELRIMFPMIADVSEFDAARQSVDKELARLKQLGLPLPSPLLIGTMLEVPSLAWQLKNLLPKIDFLSIGTNDLLQFFFAADRSNPKLANRYDLLSPSVLSFISSVIVACEKGGVPVTLCGEMGGRPLEAMALAGIGIRNLSLSPAAIGPVKMMIRSLRIDALQEFLLPLLDSPEHSLRDALRGFAREHDINV